MSERDKIVRWLSHRWATGGFCIEGEAELGEIIVAIERGDHLAWKPEPTVSAEEWMRKSNVGP